MSKKTKRRKVKVASDDADPQTDQKYSSFSTFPQFRRFPLEIQRLVVVEAAQHEILTTTRLMRVSRAFREWVRPVLYQFPEIYSLTPTQLWDFTSEADPQGFRYITDLILVAEGFPFFDAGLLDKCVNLRNFGIWNTERVTPDGRMNPLSFLRETAIWACKSRAAPRHIVIFDACAFVLRQIDIHWDANSIFRNCTHLQVIFADGDRSVLSRRANPSWPFHRMSKLTHLALRFHEPGSVSESVIARLKDDIIKASPSLQYLVLGWVEASPSPGLSRPVRDRIWDVFSKGDGCDSACLEDWIYEPCPSARNPIWLAVEEEMARRSGKY
ncbi:hypothetical protein SISNIDRAFT_457086, partial [Sistotremastrum niveocremeum HHB9708]